MGFKKILVNTLLAVVCALPLASLESRFSIPNTDLFTPKSVGLEIQEPGHVGLRSGGPDLLDTINDKMRRRYSPRRVEQRYDRFIRNISRDHGISPALVKAVIKAESGFDPNAVSPVGAIGLMQVMPETARRVGIHDPYDPQSNIRAGVRYLKQLLDQFEDDESLALAAYNSGPAKVLKFGGVPPTRKLSVSSAGL